MRIKLKRRLKIGVLNYRYNSIDSFARTDSELVEFSSIKNLYDIQKGSHAFYLPDVIIWEITNFCPLDCKHCYLETKNQFMNSNEDIDNILEIIEKSGAFQVQLTGGEALTHPHFDYIIDQLIDKGIIISVSTSGMVLNNHILECLCEIKKVRGSYHKSELRRQ